MITLHLGDCLDVMRGMEADSVDSVITDPPYGLGTEPDALAMLAAWLHDGEYEHNGSGGFMGKDWDKFVPGPHYWREVLRVMKPGATALVFGGTRTVDLTTLALRIAGFEIRDVVMWVHGQGFPKGHDISKAIDKAAGAEREVVGQRTVTKDFDAVRAEESAMGNLNKAYVPGHPSSACQIPITAPATEAAALWDGWNVALKPAYEPIIVAMKPREASKWIVQLTPELLDEWEEIECCHE